jgi:hypothetical protein
MFIDDHYTVGQCSLKINVRWVGVELHNGKF